MKVELNLTTDELSQVINAFVEAEKLDQQRKLATVETVTRTATDMLVRFLDRVTPEQSKVVVQ